VWNKLITDLIEYRLILSMAATQDTMVVLAPWMVDEDRVILEFLASVTSSDWDRVGLPATVIHQNLRINDSTDKIRRTIAYRLDRLKDAGLVDTHTDKAYFYLTESGKEFVNGEIGPDEIESPD
jgi:repressor of nif and glnA expression